jgi:hypothetical protein
VQAEQRRRIAELERALGKKTYELEISGKLLRDWQWACASPGPVNSSPRATRPRWWRAAQISRQAISRVPKQAPASARRAAAPADDVEAAIVEVAEANQTDGYRMVCALVCRKLGRAVNRKRVLRVMRERRLIQRHRRLDRRRRPGFFRVT